jgi:hypothetical protein
MIAIATPNNSTLRRRAVVAAGLLLGVAIAGCSSPNSEPGPISSPTAAAAATPRSSAVATNNADITAIRGAYSRFFNPATPLNESETLLQDGAAFKSTLKQQAMTSFAKTTTVTVSKVTLDSPDKATVVYTILLGGAPVLADTTGFAVHQDDKWKVAGATFCGLLSAQGPPPPICAQATATSAAS